MVKTPTNYTPPTEEDGNSDIETGFQGPPLKGGGVVEGAAMGCAMICVSIFVLGLGITTAYFGFADEDSTCQKGTRGGLNLSDWVKGAGLSACVLAGCEIILGFLAGCTDGKTMIVGGVLSAIDVVFWIIWWIWGVVILATNENNRCVSDGKAMAVMCIINLCIGEIRFAYLSAFAEMD